MKSVLYIIVFTVSASLTLHGEEGRSSIGVMLDELIRLQDMGEKKAILELREICSEEKKEDMELSAFMLCSLLFQAKENYKIRAPRLGAPDFVGGTSEEFWPIKTVAVYRGVPIIVTTGYTLFGTAEQPMSYLDYCVKDCNWRTTKYKSRSNAEIREIVDDFIKITKWPKPLDEYDIKSLTEQASLRH